MLRPYKYAVILCLRLTRTEVKLKKEFKMTILVVGTRVDFVHNHPTGLSPEILVGTVVEVSTGGKLGAEYKIQPDNKYRMARWRRDCHIVAVGSVVSLQA